MKPNKSQIYYKAHTHPMNSFPSDSDFRYSKVFGIGGVCLWLENDELTNLIE